MPALDRPRPNRLRILRRISRRASSFRIKNEPKPQAYDQANPPPRLSARAVPGLCPIAANPACSQTAGTGENFTTRLQRVIDPATGGERPVLTRFTLDFPGGTPKQLVTAIEKAMGKPLNAIIPPEHADVKLPPLKMSNVDVSQLFQALELTSQKTEAYVTGTYSRRWWPAGTVVLPTGPHQLWLPNARSVVGRIHLVFLCGETDLAPGAGPATVKVCRYFSLSPFLEHGQTVDDITTAIQTGWKMLGDDDTPSISFHKETKLLIAVGEPGKLETIDAVLEALRPRPSSPFIDPATGLPVAPIRMNVDPATGLPVPAAPKLPRRELEDGAGRASKAITILRVSSGPTWATNCSHRPSTPVPRRRRPPRRRMPGR